MPASAKMTKRTITTERNLCLLAPEIGVAATPVADITTFRSVGYGWSFRFYFGKSSFSGHPIPDESGNVESMNARHDPRVDQYIDPLPEWQQEICLQLRELVLGVDPDMAET